MEVTYLKRLKDGVVLPIPNSSVEDTLKQGFERIGDVVINGDTPEVVVDFKCPLCDRTFKTIQGLRVHKSRHK